MDYLNIYRDIAPKETIVNGALAYARGRVGSHGVVTLDALKEGALEVVKTLATDKLAAWLDRLLADSSSVYEMVNGARPDGEQDAWLDAFEAHLLGDLGADLQRVIGPSVIGEHFTDPDVDDPEIRLTVAREAAVHLAHNVMPMDDSDPNNVKPSINKTLSAAGVVDTDFSPYMSGKAITVSTVAKSFIDEPQARAAVERIAGAYALRMADKFDPLVLDELLASAFDDDHFISIGGIERLGGTVADQLYFASYIKAAPGEARSNTLSAAMEAFTSGALVETPKPAAGNKIKVDGAPVSGRGRKGKGATVASQATQAVASASPGVPPQTVNLAVPAAVPTPTVPGGAPHSNWNDIVTLWADCKITDERIASFFDVSRGHISNVRAGKSKLTPTPQQAAAAKAHVAALAEKLGDLAKRMG